MISPQEAWRKIKLSPATFKCFRLICRNVQNAKVADSLQLPLSRRIAGYFPLPVRLGQGEG